MELVEAGTAGAEKELGATAALILKTQDSLQASSYAMRSVADTLFALSAHFSDLLQAHELIPAFDQQKAAAVQSREKNDHT